MLKQIVLWVLIWTMGAVCCLAESEEKKDGEAPEKEEATGEDKKNNEIKEPVETRHTLSIGGVDIPYLAVSGTLPILKDDGTVKARIFYIAYTREGIEDLSGRPVTFCFNGGPGSSSVWLHMGIFGPKRVRLNGDGTVPPPPYDFVDNEYSLLDTSDLVFIDPVSTGYSRVEEEEEVNQFHGVKGDIESVGEFIRLYVTRHERWASPKYLAGESYGTTRAAGLSGHLQKSLGMELNGLVLVSTVLDFATLRFDAGNDVPYPLLLPSYTAAAWYHKRLDPELQEDFERAIEVSETFARDEYLKALWMGSALPDDTRNNVARKLARLTGLSVEFVEQCNLKINMARFMKELLRDERRTVGRMDSRLKGIDRDAAGEHPEWDPALSGLMGPFTAAFNHYCRTQLKYEEDLPYEILSRKIHPWKYDDYKNRYLNMSATLRSSMTRNPHLKVFVAAGYHDLATPYYATEYTINRLGLEPGLRSNVTLKVYEGGHMMYAVLETLRRMKKDLVDFYR